MKNELTITLVQTDNHWEKIDDNLEMLSNKIFGIQEEVDLLLLPELFTTGFTMTGVNLGESMDGKTVSWMKDWANKKDCLVAGSVLIEEKGKLYNRFVAAFPGGDGLFPAPGRPAGAGGTVGGGVPALSQAV